MEQIVIKGDSVILQSVTEEKRISTEDFHKQLMKSQNMSTPILPQRVIHYSKKDKVHIYVTMQAPTSNTIKIQDNNNSDEQGDYSLKLPYIYFIHKYINFAFEKLYIFCSNQEISNEDDLLYLLPLKNLYSDGNVCLGNDLKFDLQGKLKQKLTYTEQYFWNSNFNSDLDSHYSSTAPAVIEGKPIENWAELSKDDSFNPCDIDWRAYLTLEKTLTNIRGGV